MTTEMLLQKSHKESSSDPLWVPVPIDVAEMAALETVEEMHTCADSKHVDAEKQVESPEFSIDELREIARHFGVPDRAQITERVALVEAIRRRI